MEGLVKGLLDGLEAALPKSFLPDALLFRFEFNRHCHTIRPLLPTVNSIISQASRPAARLESIS
jgi:hypothetical protein